MLYEVITDQTAAAITETLKIMEKLRREIPEGELELKRLDALNSFVITSYSIHYTKLYEDFVMKR